MLRLEAHFPSSCADISCQRKCPQHLYWMKLNSAVLLQRFPAPDRMDHFIWNMIWQAEVHNVMLQFIQAKLSYRLNKQNEDIRQASRAVSNENKLMKRDDCKRDQYGVFPRSIHSYDWPCSVPKKFCTESSDTCMEH